MSPKPSRYHFPSHLALHRHRNVPGAQALLTVTPRSGPSRKPARVNSQAWPHPALRKHEMTRTSVLQALWRESTTEMQGSGVIIASEPRMPPRLSACLARTDTVRPVPNKAMASPVPSSESVHSPVWPPQNTPSVPVASCLSGLLSTEAVSVTLTLPFTVQSPVTSPLSRHMGSPHQAQSRTMLPEAATLAGLNTQRLQVTQ